MRKLRNFYRYLNTIHPIGIGLIALVLFALTIKLFKIYHGDGVEFIKFGATIFLIGIPTLIIIIRQADIQRNTIKLQMFDKRFDVFKSYVETYIAMKKDETNFEWILSSNSSDEARIKLLSLKKNLLSSAFLSGYVYDPEYAKELDNIRVEFDRISTIFINTLVSDDVLKDEEKMVLLEQIAFGYCNYIKNSKMKNHFSKYLSIHNLDRM